MSPLHRAEIHTGWGHLSCPLGCTPQHVLVAHHASDAELVVLRRDGGGANRYPIGGSPYGVRVLAISPRGATVLGHERILRVTFGDPTAEVIELPAASFRGACEVDGRVVVLDAGHTLRVVEVGALRALSTLETQGQILGSTAGHVIVGAGRSCLAIDPCDGALRALPLTGEFHESNLFVSSEYIVHARTDELRDGAMARISVLDASSLEPIDDWSWPGTAHQLRATRPLIAALLLSAVGGPVLRVRSLATQAELDLPLPGPAGGAFSRATPDLAGAGGVIVAMQDGLTAITELPTGLSQAHLALETADPEWRHGTTLGGALAAVDGASRVLSLDLPRDDEATEVLLQLGAVPPPSGGVRAKVVYAGVTPIAIVQDPTHGRLNVTQPSDGPRLKTGDEVVIDNVETRPGGVVAVLAWHHVGVSASVRQQSVATWRWGARLSVGAEPPEGTRWREALGPRSAELGPHRADLERIASLHDRSPLFRSRFAMLGIELSVGWAEETDMLAEMMPLPAKRYVVFARHVDDPIFYAVDREDHGLVELTWQDGEMEPLPGPTSVLDLIEERIDFLIECFPDDEELAARIAHLRADLAGG